jgi:arabinofuranan 3-O-arabinosyltransferase
LTGAIAQQDDGAGTGRRFSCSRGIFSGPRAGTGLFTEQRLFLYGSTIIVAYVVGLVWRWLRHEWVIRSDGNPTCIDFSWIWVSGTFAASSEPAQAYDYSTFSAARAVLAGPGGCIFLDNQFDYPPTLLFLTYPLGLLPYSTAFAVWMVATLPVYLAALYAIIPRPAAVVVALTTSPVVFNVLLGHNGFLTAGLIGLSLALMERRPWLSGIFLGLLTYKPQFGILFPFVLLATRNWRSLASAAGTSVILGMAAAIAFGYQTWPAFLSSLIGREASLSEVEGLPIPLLSAFGVLQSMGVSTRIAWIAHLAIAVAVAAGVFAIWAKRIPHSLKAAALCIGSVTVTPYVLGYDFCVLSIAVAFFVSDGLSRGFLSGERATMFGCWVGLFVLSGPVPLVICVILLVLVVRRAVVWRRDSFATAGPVPPLFADRVA